jgi:hypothetical protein
MIFGERPELPPILVTAMSIPFAENGSFFS